MTNSPLSMDLVDNNSSLRHGLTLSLAWGEWNPPPFFGLPVCFNIPHLCLKYWIQSFHTYSWVLTVAWPVGDAGGLGLGKTPSCRGFNKCQYDVLHNIPLKNWNWATQINCLTNVCNKQLKPWQEINIFFRRKALYFVLKC